MQFNKRIITVFLLVIISCFGWQISKVDTVSVMAGVCERIIFLDSGHGGWDPGKVSVAGTLEKDVNLEITKYLQSYLEEGGATVILSRNKDEALAKSKTEDLKERLGIAQDGEADLIVSIHQNAFPQSNVKGAQVFYYGESEEGQKLAEYIQERLISEVDNSNKRQAKANKDYYILKSNEVTSVIVECGFLSNANEEKKLNDPEYEQKIAWAIYLGIVDYFNSI